jgi:hypothetical protein
VTARELFADYYVYLYRDPATGWPIYIGKGKGNRAKSHRWGTHNLLLHRFLHDHPQVKPEIVFRGHEGDALDVEESLIAQHRHTLFNVVVNEAAEHMTLARNVTTERLADPDFRVPVAKRSWRYEPSARELSGAQTSAFLRDPVGEAVNDVWRMSKRDYDRHYGIGAFKRIKALLKAARERRQRSMRA